MTTGKKLFWGVLFVLGAFSILAGSTGLLKGISFWTILLTIGLAGILLDGIRCRSWGKILFALAFLGIVNRHTLHIEALTPGPLLGAALLGTIGLNILFPRRQRPYFRAIGTACGTTNRDGYSSNDYQVMPGSDDAEHVRCENAFGSCVKYINCGQLKTAQLENSFGKLSVYLDNAVLKDHSAQVKVDTSFGVMELFVPSNWMVISNVGASFGHVQQHGQTVPDGVNVLNLYGEVAFGALEIYYN